MPFGLLANEPSAEPASAGAVGSSLESGVAWIWPDSNGPLATAGHRAPYREAAVLVESLVLRAHGVERGGRNRALTLATSLATPVRLVPIVHVEAASDAPDELTGEQRAAIVAAVLRRAGAAAAGAGLLQLDFEAPPRQLAAYRRLVTEVRGALPSGIRLSVTALAHWCAQGDWLDRLPVDEVVTMLYRLGSQSDSWRRRFLLGDPSLARRCRGPVLGFATNDPPPMALLARTTRAYWFDENRWSNPSRPPRYLVP